LEDTLGPFIQRKNLRINHFHLTFGSEIGTWKVEEILFKVDVLEGFEKSITVARFMAICGNVS